MNYLIFILLILGFLFFFRGTLLARGNLKEKLFAKESFLTWQKLIALDYLIVIILAIVTLAWPYIIFAGICELLDFLFYLQPTPRISKIILYIFLVANIGFIFYLLWGVVV